MSCTLVFFASSGSFSASRIPVTRFSSMAVFVDSASAGAVVGTAFTEAVNNSIIKTTAAARISVARASRPCRTGGTLVLQKIPIFSSLRRCDLLFTERVDVVLRILPVDLLRRIQPVDVLLNVRIAVAVQVPGGVAGVVGIQTIFGLPCIRDSVLV